MPKVTAVMAAVSVVIPTFNRAALVERAVHSVLTQTYSDIEVLIVDDGSTDNTGAVLRSLAHEDSRIRYLHHERNQGAQPARNTGCLAANGEYIAFLDSDNEWLPDKLRLQMEVFKRGGDQLGVVYCGFRVLYPDQSYFDMWPRYRGNVYQQALSSTLYKVTGICQNEIDKVCLFPQSTEKGETMHTLPDEIIALMTPFAQVFDKRTWGQGTDIAHRSHLGAREAHRDGCAAGDGIE